MRQREALHAVLSQDAQVFQSGMKPAMQAVSTSDVFGNASTS